MDFKKPNEQESQFLILLKGRTNATEYLFLLHRIHNQNETLADSARKIGIREEYARKIASRLRLKINNILGIEKK